MPIIRSVPWKRFLGRNPAVTGPALLKHCGLVSPTAVSTCGSLPSESTYRILTQQQQLKHSHTESSLHGSVVDAWDDESVRKALDEIWFHINKNKAREAPDRALEILESLLDQEAIQNKPLLEKGIVINLLRYCQKRSVSGVSSLDRLERVLEKLHQNENLWDSKIPSMILLAMTSCRNSKVAPQRAEMILLKEIENPRQDHYGAVLHCYAQQGMGEQAEQLLHRMEERHANHELFSPNNQCYNCVINAHAKSGKQDSPKRAKAILRRMEKNPEVQPDVISYTTLLNCYSRLGMANEAEELLQQMEEWHKAGMLEEGPNSSTFNTVINALARSRERDAPQRAEALFNRMLEMQAAENTQVHPDRYTGGAMLRCYANHGNVQGAYRFVQRMHELHLAGEFKDGPTIAQYNALLHVLAKSKEPDAGQRAEDILNLLHEMHSSGYPHIQPDSLSYSIVLDCYGQRGMAKEAMKLIQQMHNQYEKGELKNGPNTSCYNCAINAVANSKDPDAPELAQALVYRMQLFAANMPNIQPDVITFNSLLKVYAKAGWASEAEETLQEMYNLRKRGQLRDGPDVASYRCVIQLLSKSGDANSLSRAEQLLDQMFEFHGAKGSHVNKEVDIKIFTMLLNGYANLGMSREAEQLLERMHDLHDSGAIKRPPNRISFNCVMNALAKCTDWDAPERAEALMARMQEQRIDPCMITLNSLLNVYAKEGMVKEAERTLEQMHDLHNKGVLKGGPDHISYSIIFNALTKGGGKEAYKKAEVHLKRMLKENSYVKPDEGAIRSFLLCFKACGKLEEGKQVLKQLR